MKIYINASINNDTIPAKDEYFAEVEEQDIEIIEALANIRAFSGRLITIPSTRNELGKTPNYSKEDKCIHTMASKNAYREYAIPYTAYDRSVRAYRIYTFPLYIYNDGSFQFGSKGKIRQFGQVADNTLSKDMMNARNEF